MTALMCNTYQGSPCSANPEQQGVGLTQLFGPSHALCHTALLAAQSVCSCQILLAELGDSSEKQLTMHSLYPPALSLCSQLLPS